MQNLSVPVMESLFTHRPPGVEIVEFIRPDSNEKNLYISNFPGPDQVSENDIHAFLFNKFSRYGLLYEVQVCARQALSWRAAPPPQAPAQARSSGSVAQEGKDAPQAVAGYYAFVKFYSARAAACAKRRLVGRLYMNGQHLKVQFSRRKKTLPPQGLYVSKCYELANHSLGFNGWSSEIIMLKEHDDFGRFNPEQVQYYAVVRLRLPKHELHCEGVGMAMQMWRANDSASKSVAVCKAKKQAYRTALESAFRKVVLVLLDNGKVYPEVNTTLEESIEEDPQLEQDSVLKVTELEFDPKKTDWDTEGDREEEEEAADDVNENTLLHREKVDIDQLNQQILQELEEEEQGTMR